MKVEIKIDETCQETTVIIVANTLSDEVNALAHSLSVPHADLIIGFRDDSAVVIGLEKIIRIYTANQKVYIVTHEGEYAARWRLYEFEERLPPQDFVRISHSEIINLKKAKNLDLSIAGSICVRFLDGTTTYVSRRYVAKIKKILGL